MRKAITAIIVSLIFLFSLAGTLNTKAAAPLQDTPAPVYYSGDPIKTSDSYAFTGQSTYNLGLPCPDVVYQAVYTDTQGNVKPMLRCVEKLADPPHSWESGLTPRLQRITAVCTNLECFHAYFPADNPPPGFNWDETWMVIAIDAGFPDSGPIVIKWVTWCNWLYTDGIPTGSQEVCATGTITMQRQRLGSLYDIWYVAPQKIQYSDGSWHPWYGCDVLRIEPIEW